MRWLPLLAALSVGSGHARQRPPPTGGLADLHLHQWGEHHFAGRWLHGEAQGPVDEALAAGPLGGAAILDGAGGRSTNGVAAHAAVAALGGLDSRSARVGRRLTAVLGTINDSDDTTEHPPAGPSSRPALPHWLGWPTADSIAHQQVWEGWLRLAHDGMPLLYHLRRRVLFLDDHGGGVAVRCSFLERSGMAVDACENAPTVAISALSSGDQARLFGAAVSEFRGAGYAGNQRVAAARGHGGLQLAVVSLVHFRTLCSVLQPSGRAASAPPLRPADCVDTRNLKIQAARAHAWVEANQDWVALARTPADARRAWDQGKLAVVLGVEASDLMERPAPSIAVQLEELLALGVRVVQPMHEYDNRFGGAAPVNVAFDAAQGFRTRGHADIPPARDVHDPLYANRRFVLANHWEGVALAATRSDGWGLLGGLLRWWNHGGRWGFACSEAGSRGGGAARAERCFTGTGQWRGLPNRFGLTADGETLLRAMEARGVVIDVAHMSQRSIEDALRVLSPDTPLIHSHALPAALLASTTEHHQTEELLAALADRQGMVGLRTADDSLLDHVPASVSRLLRRVDCDGSATGLLAMVDHLADAHPGLGLAWGSDLNGFINQVGPTGQLRRDPEGRAPCSALVPSIGSEVQRRGLAHVGLLPALFQELLAIEDRLDAPAARRGLAGMAWGAERFVRLWERVDGARLGVGEDVPALPLRPLQRARLDARWEIPVPAQLPGGGQAVVSLPLLAAIEGVLPYVDGPGPRSGSGAGLVQLPATLGLELGVDTPVQQPQPPGFLEWILPEVERDPGAGQALRRGHVKKRLYGGCWSRSFVGTGAEFRDRLALALDPPAALRGTTAPEAWIPAGEWSAQTLGLRRCALQRPAALEQCVDDPLCLAAAPVAVPTERPQGGFAACRGEGGAAR